MKDTSQLYDWNKDGIADTFIIKKRFVEITEPILHYSDKAAYDYYAQDFEIKLSNKKHFELSKKVRTIDTNSLQIQFNDFPKKIRKISKIKNPYFNIFAFNKDQTKDFVFLSVIDSNLVEEPPYLVIIELDSTQTPKLVFEKIDFGLVDILDIDCDGLMEIAGFTCYTQCWSVDDTDELNEEFCTYDPINVYKYIIGKFEFELSLTENYNRKYYYGWAGPDCSEEFVVFRHKKLRKPIVIKEVDAIKLKRKLDKRLSPKK